MSLYRKYRPQQFADVLGQEHITRTLQNALTSDPPSIVHAYLFYGPRGTGKTTTARILAKALNCAQGPTCTPCGDCESCRDITLGNALDVLEIDAASHTGVDNVREVITSKVNYRPALGRYRMYIIDEAHQLSSHAFNALLKTIEEPPPHALFVLATTEYHRVPATVQSRCQRFVFHRVSAQHIAERIRVVAQAEGVRIEEAAVRALARSADGSLRDALTLLEQVISYSGSNVTSEAVHETLGTLSTEELEALTAGLEEPNAGALLEKTRELLFRGLSAAALARALATHLRDRLVEQLSRLVDADRRKRMETIELLCRAESDMRWNAAHDLVLELALLKACNLQDPQPVAAVAAPAPDHKMRETVRSAPPRVTAARRPEAVPTSPDRPPAPATSRAAPPAVATPAVRSDHPLSPVWDRVLDRVKEKGGVPLRSLLMEGTLIGLEGQRLVIAFDEQFAFHRNKVNEPAKRRIVESALREVSDLPEGVEIEFRLLAGNSGGTSGDASEGSLVDEVQKLFPGATVMP